MIPNRGGMRGRKGGLRVDGYVDFKTCLDGSEFFELYGKENRWGNEVRGRGAVVVGGG
jgi:hypothetical protein